VALTGPAVRPLLRLAIRVENGQVLIDPSRRKPLEAAERDPSFYVSI
jgi:hypothetical protein